MKNYLDFANSNTMLLICAIPIVYVVIQAVIFYQKAFKRGQEIGIEPSMMKKVTRNAGVFTIMPAIPILIFLVILAPSLGKYFPWLRLSVVGSGFYESTVANTALNAQGFETFDQLTGEGFIIILFAMSIAILAGITLNTFALKPVSKKMSKIQSNEGSFGPLLVPAIFTGLLMSFAVPYFLPKFMEKNGEGKDVAVGFLQKSSDAITTFNIPQIGSFITGIIVVLVLNYISSKQKNSLLKEFAFPVSILAGMLCAILLS